MIYIAGIACFIIGAVLGLWTSGKAVQKRIVRERQLAVREAAIIIRKLNDPDKVRTLCTALIEAQPEE